MIEKSWEKEGYTMRLSRIEDAEEYYEHNFHPLDRETARLTGCKPEFSHDEVVDFFKQCVEAHDRYDFIVLSPQGSIIGESVINEIDEKLRCASFRICLFHSGSFGKGLGSWMIKNTLAFAFQELQLHRVELEVFSFNPRARRAYEKAGFRCEGILKDAVMDGDQYADTIIMAILEDEWRDAHGR